jgi:hypothetical protein
MALVAGLGIVAVATFILMFIVHFTLSMLVAVQASKGAGVAGRMARCTREIMITRQGECVLEVGRHPGAG